MSTYTDFKSRTIGKVIPNGQCVALVVNNSQSYIEALYPGVNWTTIIQPVPSARNMAGKGNSYLTWVQNDHSNPNQVPSQGDIMIFDATPAAGYSNQTRNPDGHTGICDNANGSGYTLLQQNSPTYGSPANLTTYPWKFRPCMGWYKPQYTTQPSQPPQTAATGMIHLAPTNNDFHLYPVGGPYDPNGHVLGVIAPRLYGGLDYRVVANRGDGVYTIQTQMFGVGDIWTKGSDVTVS